MFIFKTNACLNGARNGKCSCFKGKYSMLFLFLIKIMNSGMVPCQQVAGTFRIACVNGGQDSGIP